MEDSPQQGSRDGHRAPSPLLYPFRFERFATGDLHPVSSSPYPWS
jgi:hypothetical protein